MATMYSKGPDPVVVDAADNLTTTLWRRARTDADREIVRHHADGGWRGLTWQQLAERVEAVAAGLIAEGVQSGDRVALMSPTAVDWTIADLAILAVGAVTVPLYDTSSAEQCRWILSDSGAKLALADSADNAKLLEAARSDAALQGEIFVLADGGLDTLAARAGGRHRELVRERVAETGTDALASIIYTSGTTGSPKGCMLTHGNLLSIARQVEVQLPELFEGDSSTLLFLPLAHVFARIVQFGCLEAHAKIVFSRGADHLIDDLAATQPTFLLAVPRLFEKVFNGAQRKAEGAKAKIFQMAVSTGRRWSEATDAGRSPGLPITVAHRLMDKLVYAKLRAALGGRVRHCLSGGAPLAPHLAHFFNAAGVTILEGYGLTETSAPCTVNTVKLKRIGTVGVPLPGVEIKIADDGEILIHSPGNFPGYWHDEEATGHILQGDGWLRSGDIGEIDQDGFVKITGRKKEIIVTAGGKNVAPAVLEERLKAHRLVSQAMVVGDRRPFIAALITLDAEELAAFAREHELSGDMTALSQAAPVVAEVQRAVDDANGAVSRAESIRTFHIVPRDFSMEAGELTPKLSVRRHNVERNFAADIERLYEG